MAPLHPFLLQSISRVRDFLDQLVDVEEGEGEFPGPWPGLSQDLYPSPKSQYCTCASAARSTPTSSSFVLCQALETHST